MGNFHTIREREKCIAGHNGAFQIKPKRNGLGDCLTKGIYPTRLPAAHSDQLVIFYKRYGVGFQVFGTFGRKKQFFNFLGSRHSFGDGFEIGFRFSAKVCVLLHHAVEQTAESAIFDLGIRFQQDALLFLFQQFQRFRIKIRGNEHLVKKLVDLLRSRYIHFCIRNKNASESRGRVAGQRGLPGFQQGVGRTTTGIGVF